MVEVRRQPKENIGSMLRRFSERIKKSGVLIEAKESQHYKKPKSKRQRRQAAMMRSVKQAEYKEKTRQGIKIPPK